MNDGLCLSDYWHLFCEKAQVPQADPEQFRQALQAITNYQDRESLVDLLIERSNLLHGLGTTINMPPEVEAAIVFSTMPAPTARRVWAVLARQGCTTALTEQLQSLPPLPREFVVYAWHSFCDRLDVEPGQLMHTVQKRPRALARHLSSMLAAS
jgi:hypothetical protein